MIGGLLALLVGGAALFALLVLDRREKDRTVVEDYRTVYHLGRDTIAVFPLAAENARGSVHVRVHRRAGRIFKVEHLQASDVVHATETIEHLPDGSRRIVHVDGYDDHEWTMTVGPGDRVVATQRSGAPLWQPCSALRLQFDEKGRARESACLDGAGAVIQGADGCAISRLEYDERGSKIAEGCFDAGGAPAEFHEGGHRVAYVRGPDGLVRSSARFDASGRAAQDEDGCFSEVYTVDAAGQDIEETCLDAAGNPTGRSGGNVATRTWERDANGCIVKEEYLDPQEAPTEQDGVATTVYRRNVQCGVTHVEHLDIEGRLVQRVQRPASTERTFDARGRMVEERCSDAERQPVSCVTAEGTDGSLVQREYDERNLETRSRCFDATGAKSPCGEEHPHEERSTYDAVGNHVSTTYHATDGSPAPALSNVHRKTMEYDASGHLISRKSFGIDDRPVAPSTACHEIRWAYDKEGRLSAVECRDVGGQYVDADLCMAGVCWDDAARVAVERLSGKVRNVFYSQTGALVKLVDCGAAACYE